MPVRDVRSDMQKDAIREGGKLIPSGVMTPFVYCRVLTSLEEPLDAQQPDIELHHRPQYGNYVVVSARRDSSGRAMRPGEYAESAAESS